MMASSRKGKALITGASTGIGAVYADRLAKRGYDLVVVARHRRRLDDLAKRLAASTGCDVDVLDADLTSPDDLQRVVQRLVADTNITLLVNNAGVASVSILGEADGAVTGAIIDLNVTAFTHLAAAAAHKFKQLGGGTLNLASVSALRTRAEGSVYAATKAYELSLTQSLSIELADAKVRV